MPEPSSPSPEITVVSTTLLYVEKLQSRLASVLATKAAQYRIWVKYNCINATTVTSATLQLNTAGRTSQGTCSDYTAN